MLSQKTILAVKYKKKFFVQEVVWMKSSIFDFIIYKIIMSVPVSIIANIIFAYMFFIVILRYIYLY